MEKKNPVKEYLFDHIKESEEKFKKLISENKFGLIVNDIILNCYDKVVSKGPKDENLGVLATGILHYLLTNSLIPSQRKIDVRETEIDIVIPDLKTLQNYSKKALIICIPKTSDTKKIQEKIQELQKLQPEKKNIWLVMSEHLSFENKTFVISKENSSFSEIIFDIAQFVNVNAHDKFKILRI